MNTIHATPPARNTLNAAYAPRTTPTAQAQGRVESGFIARSPRWHELRGRRPASRLLEAAHPLERRRGVVLLGVGGFDRIEQSRAGRPPRAHADLASRGELNHASRLVEEGPMPSGRLVVSPPPPKPAPSPPPPPPR